MAFSIRRALAELMGKEQVSDEDLRRELDELKVDQKLEAMQRDGHLGADPAILEIARAAIKGTATPDQLEKLIRAPKPTPAATTTVKPPAGPDLSNDPTEAAIRQEMEKTGKPYHEAALAVTTGGSLQTTTTEATS